MSRFIAGLMILLAFSGAALAEAYQIRVTWPTRLRASPSLDSPKVELALAGDVLQVVGKSNRWLKIDRGGEIVWMADWVDYVRLDEAATSVAVTTVTGAGVSADIDNCCFVNRQCQSDQEWVDGYWAYQRNECPTQSQPDTSTGLSFEHAIHIEASPLNIAFINEALNRLRAGSQKWYDYVISGADLIREDPNIFAGAALSSQRIILIASYGRNITVFDMDVNLAGMVATLVHEACHVHHRDAGFVYDGYTKVNEELACNEQAATAVREALPPHLHSEYATLGVPHCEGDLTNHPRCRFYRENCEWSADNSKIISCPAIGLTRPSN